MEIAFAFQEQRQNCMFNKLRLTNVVCKTKIAPDSVKGS